ncbi:hypothetical protein WJX75_000432 [Coccomyxa subellipsoidea]|uniref:Uncharacterized protein n=1 Tax=Coccomyxa subellipsoidea TaxID=248742 RepID=A0ABR2YLT0_9CHLO
MPNPMGLVALWHSVSSHLLFNCRIAKTGKKSSSHPCQIIGVLTIRSQGTSKRCVLGVHPKGDISMALYRALCAALIFYMLLVESHGSCDYGPRDRLNSQPYDALILGSEEDWTDVARLTIEVIAAAFGGEGPLQEDLAEKGVKEVKTVGIKNILKLVQSGGSLVVGDKRLITLTTDHQDPFVAMA